ncbi:MAG: DUF1638 domain-containing protein [Phycisphaerales bacterium]
MAENSRKILIIACKILMPDIQAAAKKTGIDADLEFLPLGLHNTPDKLVTELQAAINKATSEKYSRIILGYGICGKGTNGIKAGELPLVIPQVHDCISLFLGSAARYQEQFEKCPGTYYFTKGWFDETPNYEISLRIGLNIDTGGKIYTEEEIKILEEFLAGWQKNYSRAVFVRTPSNPDDENYRQKTKKIAQGYNWKYEEILGNTNFFEKILVTETSDDEILIVQPGQTLIFDEIKGKLGIQKNN